MSTPSRRKPAALTKLKKSPQLEAAAQRHTARRAQQPRPRRRCRVGRISAADRARDAGYRGRVAETVAINNSLAINDLDVTGNWSARSDYWNHVELRETQIGVWSENSVDPACSSRSTGSRTKKRAMLLAGLMVTAMFYCGGTTLAHAVPAPDIEFIYDTTVRKQYSFANTADAIATPTAFATRSPAGPATAR